MSLVRGAYRAGAIVKPNVGSQTVWTVPWGSSSVILASSTSFPLKTTLHALERASSTGAGLEISVDAGRKIQCFLGAKLVGKGGASYYHAPGL